MLQGAPLSRPRTEKTVAFVNLAGFAALTETHGDMEAARIAQRFAALARSAVEPGGRLVKTLGDAVMLAFADPREGLAGVRRLLQACWGEQGFPEPRAGLHHGAVIEKRGDLFGSTVNLAARAAARATGAQTLTTSVVAQVAAKCGIETIPLGAFELRNVSKPVELWELRLSHPHEDSFFDPVCHMRVPARQAIQPKNADTQLGFCSQECADRFSESAGGTGPRAQYVPPDPVDG